MAESRSHRQELAKAIRDYRKKAKMTQAQLAEEANLSSKFIGEVERVEKGISMDNLVRIGKALKVPMRDLVWGIHY